jgi:hypothetical protein
MDPPVAYQYGQMLLQRLQTFLKRKPDQKARAIAAQLDEDRSEVNRVLHDHPHVFSQDPEKFTWSLAALNVYLDSRWLTADDLENALLQAGSPLDAREQRIPGRNERSFAVLRWQP